MSNPMAFPSEQHECADGSWNQTYDPGMSLRDWFAGQFLVGRGSLVADPDEVFTDANGNDLMTASGIAASCYQMADAMLAERSKGDTQ